VYGKLFAQTWEGSMCGKPDVQLVWCFLLAHSDGKGIVEKSRPNISALTGIPIDRVNAAIEHLEAPDPDSRTPAEEGRRLLRLVDHRDWGWRIVNHALYRGMRDEEARKEQTRAATQRYRQRQDGPGLTPAHGDQGEPKTEDRSQKTENQRTSAAVPEPHRDGPPDSTQGRASLPAAEPEAGVLALESPPAAAGYTGPSLPLAGSGIEWRPGDRLLGEFEALYPGVNLGRSFAAMRGWLLTHPKNRPTGRGIAAFVNNWLRSDQDKAAGGAARPSNRRAGARRGSDARYGDANAGGGNGQ